VTDGVGIGAGRGARCRHPDERGAVRTCVEVDAAVDLVRLLAGGSSRRGLVLVPHLARVHAGAGALVAEPRGDRPTARGMEGDATGQRSGIRPGAEGDDEPGAAVV